MLLWSSPLANSRKGSYGEYIRAIEKLMTLMFSLKLTGRQFKRELGQGE